VLREYMTLVDYIRTYHDEHNEEDLAAAISWGIDRCIAENVLKEFLIENRSEVEKVITLDYTFERRLELQHEEGREEGRIAEIISSVQAGDYSIERAAEKLNITVDEARRQMEEYVFEKNP
jgi:rRNA maturation endonuclease Nob1